MIQPPWSASTERIKATSLYRFMQEVDRSLKKNFTQLNSLYKWSVDTLESFWVEQYPMTAKTIPVPDIPDTFKYLPDPSAGAKTLP